MEKLIERVRDNDSEACKEMFGMFHKMIYSIINEFELNYGDFRVSADDLYQEACIAVYDACMAYRDKGARFSTFVYLVIKRRLKRYYRASIRRYANESVSIDNIETPDHQKEFICTNVSENPLVYHKQGQLYERIGDLCEMDRRILLLRIQNYSYQEIASMLGTSTKKIDNRLYRLRKQLLEKEKH